MSERDEHLTELLKERSPEDRKGASVMAETMLFDDGAEAEARGRLRVGLVPEVMRRLDVASAPAPAKRPGRSALSYALPYAAAAVLVLGVTGSAAAAVGWGAPGLSAWIQRLWTGSAPPAVPHENAAEVPANAPAEAPSGASPEPSRGAETSSPIASSPAPTPRTMRSGTEGSRTASKRPAPASSTEPSPVGASSSRRGMPARGEASRLPARGEASRLPARRVGPRDNDREEQRDGPRPSASERFEAANRARDEGKVSRALEGYRQLRSAHPRTPEAIASFVSEGRIEMGRGRAAQALRAFRSYLRRQPSGVLAEAAWVGVAEAARHLGQPDVESEAWGVVRRRFPRSIHAARAQRRLEALGIP